MPRCPVCGSEIEYLKNYVKAEKLYLYDGEKYKEGGFYILCTDPADGNYECPKCEKVLFTSEEEAKKFLKGG